MTYQFEPHELHIELWPPANNLTFAPLRMPKGIRVTHLPTGTVCVSTELRNQFLNREAALSELYGIVAQMPTHAELTVMVGILRNAVVAALEGELLDIYGNRDDNGLLAGHQTRYGVSELTTAMRRLNELEHLIANRPKE